MGTYSLWVEGFTATGEHGGARHLGDYEGETFEDAVRAWDRAENARNTWGHLVIDDEGCRVWGCQIFDNREDAQRSFG